MWQKVCNVSYRLVVSRQSDSSHGLKETDFNSEVFKVALFDHPTSMI